MLTPAELRAVCAYLDALHSLLDWSPDWAAVPPRRKHPMRAGQVPIFGKNGWQKSRP